MYPIKNATAITVPFFAHDVNGDGVTGLVDGGFTKRISKNGGAFAAMTVTITEMENGWYSFPLSTAHSDTNGILSISFSHASTKRVNMQWRVETRLIDDLATPTNITAATGIVLSGVTHTGAVIPTVTTVTNDVGITQAGADKAWSTAARVLTAGTNIALAKGTGVTGFNDLDAAGVAAATWNAATATYGTAGSYGLLVETNIDATISSRSTYAGGAVASVTAGVTVTTNNDKTGYSLTVTPPTAIENADALLDRNMSTGTDSGSPTVRTVRQSLRFLRNKWSIATGTLTVTKEDDTTASWTATVTTDAAAIPIIGNDPA